MTSISFGLSTLLFLYTLVAEPLLGLQSYKKLSGQVAVDPAARSRYYLRLLVLEWSWVVAVVLILLGIQHPLVSIGLQMPINFGWPATAGALTGLVVVTLVSLRVKRLYALIQAQLTPAAALLPVTGRQRVLYATVCLTAGFCEELLFRGFLIFYLTIIAPWLPVALVITVAGAIFGLGHLYQGRRAILMTGLLGIAFGALYWLTGSLLPGMILHALIDLRAILYWPPRTA